MRKTVHPHRCRLCRSRRGHFARGAAAIEFAIVCPLMVLMALACADFGRVAHHFQVLTNAARTAAETGATQQFTDFTRADWRGGHF